MPTRKFNYGFVTAVLAMALLSGWKNWHRLGSGLFFAILVLRADCVIVLPF